MNEYEQIKSQISFAVTGRQPITCPSCNKEATATTSGFKKIYHKKSREVKTTCRHCHTQYTFIWN
jgi:transcription elongation factor Elf1